ncbi:S10 family peptidase [Pseudoduganella ginsengisoli]|uniref:Peptidase S10 n=1 Tax=Pseudoduganella ginsengisoli TaxID=1462440 RepID=A0A6L6PWB7_9BURK|nr:peptidase S10 [Pseudoduganella ginsengisoli]
MPAAAVSLATAFLLTACGGGGGGGGTAAATPPVVTPPVSGDGALNDPVVYSGNPAASLASATESAAIVKSSMVLNGQTIAYTATTGHLTATDARTGRAASFFYVAYTADGKAPGSRPVTFFYNGGPGSASMWLHLGSFAPKRIPTQIPSNTILSANTALVDNAESLLDVSDLVFVDAVGTGYSQAISPARNRDFWGVDADAAGFRDFVQRYVAANNRQQSPTVLFGESYGAPRTGILANLLETAGTRVSGVVLHSAIMDYNSNCSVINIRSCEGYIPTYAATGNYYKLASPAPADVPSFLQEVRGYSSTTYRDAVGRWLSSNTLPPATVSQQLFKYTGVPASRWQANLNYGPDLFAKELLPGQLLGRYDARVSGPNGSALTADGDPSLTVVNNAVTTAIRTYMSGTLKYSAASTYGTFIDIIDTWNFKHDGKEVPDTIPDLAAAINLNPAMKVLAQSGYHDLATPFYQTELDLARLGANPNISIRNYASGHMIYLDDAARRAQKADLVQFYSSLAGK